MDDLISRQAAIDMLKNRWKKTRNYEGIGDDIAEECELYLKQVPSAQPYTDEEIQKMQDIEQAQLYKAYEMGKADAMAEIIRCRDCKLRDTEYCNMAHGFMGMKDDDYCSYAERRWR